MKLLILILLLPSFGFSTFDYNENCKQAYKEILCLRFENASKIIEQEKKYSPQNCYIVYLENYIDFLKLLIEEQEILYDSLDETFSIRIQIFTKEKTIESSHLQACMYLQWAIAEAKLHNLWSAGLNFYRAYKLTSLIASQHPDYAPVKKLQGVFYLLLSVIPDDYSLITEAIGMEGNIAQGFKELEDYYSSCQHDDPEKIETFLLLSYSYHHFHNDKSKACSFIENQNEIQADNPLLRFIYSSALLSTGRSNEVIILNEKYPRMENEFPVYFQDYLLAEAKLFRQDKDASTMFENFLREFHGKNYIKAAYLRLAWYYYLNDNMIQYNNCIKAIKEKGYSLSEPDKQALYEIEVNPEPDKILLKARLLFDGGYYNEAKELLLENASTDRFSTITLKLEYFYRLARIYDNLHDDINAIKYYNLVIETGVSSSRYFAPYSALKLAELYERQGNIEQATNLYKKCLSMNKQEYKFSTEQKAKAGLGRINRFE